MKHRRKVFTLRPGDAREGVADCPTEVLGVAVRRILLVRADRPAALVMLDDERFAVTGSVLAAGSARELAAHVRRAAWRSISAPERRWLRKCAKALGAQPPRLDVTQ
jgi:hypothetical protein